MSFKSAFAIALATALWLGGCATRTPSAPMSSTAPEHGEEPAVGVLTESPMVEGPQAPQMPHVPSAPEGVEPLPGREIARGRASWYGTPFHGRRTASGEVFNMHDLTAAHRTLPFGTRVRVRHASTGKEVVVRINDRGPFTKGRVVDLSRAAAEQIGLIQAGVGPVLLLRD